ncbi:MAG: hypothetical protein KGQ35_12460, partial [Burkholderiales bacterium]|nr:hypothetical protein [Burkholderiales bacterium]
MGAPLRAPPTLLTGPDHGLASETPFPETVPLPVQAPEPPAGAIAHRQTASFLVRSAVLEQLAHGAPLEEILELLAREIERHDVSVQVSIMLL